MERVGVGVDGDVDVELRSSCNPGWSHLSLPNGDAPSLVWDAATTTTTTTTTTISPMSSRDGTLVKVRLVIGLHFSEDFRFCF